MAVTAVDKHPADSPLFAAEKIVLGAMMLDPSTVAEVTELVDATAFGRWQHQVIYTEILAAVAADQPTDPMAIGHRLLAGDQLKRIGGMPYLHDLVEAVPATVQVGWYAGVVAEAAQRRHLSELAALLEMAADVDDPDRRRQAIERVRAQLDHATGESARARTASLYQDGASFILDAPSRIPALWGEGGRVFWAEGEALMLCGPTGVGKTTLAGQVVYGRLGLLPTVLGLPVAPGEKNVLWLASDRPSQIRRSLRRLARDEWRDVLAARLVVWKGPPANGFDIDQNLLRQMCEQVGADTVVVDSLKDVAIGLSKDEVSAGYNLARQRALQAGIEILELHHQVKRGTNDGPPNTIADVYGGGHLVNGAGSVILLWGKPGDPVVKLTHLKQPSEEVGPFWVAHDAASGSSQIQDQVDLVLLAAHAPAGITAPEAAAALFETKDPDKAQVRKARDRLNRLCEPSDGNPARLIKAKGRLGGADGTSPDTYHAASGETEPGGVEEDGQDQGWYR